MKNIVKYILATTLCLFALGLNAKTVYTAQFFSKENGLPDNDIRALRQDNVGYIWMGGQYGIYRYDGYSYQKALPGTSSNTRFLKARCLADIYRTDNLMWFAHRGDFYSCYDTKLCRFVDMDSDAKLQEAYERMRKENSTPYNIKDSQGNMLDIVDKEKVKVYFANTKKYVEFCLVSERILQNVNSYRYKVAYGHGRFWIATNGNGLFLVDCKDNSIDHITADDGRGLLKSDFLTNLMVDNHGNIWVAMERRGVVKISVVEEDFQKVMFPNKNIRSQEVRTIQMLGSGRMFVGNNSGDMATLTPAGVFTSQKSYGKKSCKCIAEGPDGALWIGTSEGLLIGDKLYLHDSNNNKTIEDNRVDCVVRDHKGRMWICYLGGHVSLAEKAPDGKWTFRHFFQKRDRMRTRKMIVDKKGQIWVTANKSLICFDPDKLVKSPNIYKVYSLGLKYTDSEVLCMTEDDKGNIWVGTNGDGVYILSSSKQWTILSEGQGLCNDVVRSILVDKQKNVWLCTSDGCTVVSESGKRRNLHFGINTLDNDFNENSAAVFSDGTVVLGSFGGIIMPDNTLNRPVKPLSEQLDITSILVNSLPINEVDSTVMSGDDNQKKIVLDYDDNNITVSFSDFSYNSDGMPSFYSYRLLGADGHWSQWSTQNTLIFNDLHSGHYTLEVRSNRSTAIRRMDIVIRPPFWRSPLAFMLYLLIVAFIAWAAYRYFRELYIMKRNLATEKAVARFRTNLFTQIAHEFRTPLAILRGGVDRIVNPDNGTVSQSALQTVRRSTQRLSRLINQLMEFRKTESGNQRLKVERGDIIATVRDIYQDFWTMAQGKGQNITYMPFAKKYEMVFDRDKVEMIIYNLLSNAVKYTPERGDISFTVKQDKETRQIVFEVANSGKAITEEVRQRLFQPFMHGYASQGGMGIGLYSSLQMAKLHKGTITYSPMQEESGSVFTLVLPNDESVYGSNDYTTTVNKVSDDKVCEQMEQLTRELLPKSLNSQLVVIVEDDPDMMQQLKETVGVYFQVKGFMDCESAKRGIPNEQPALVLCDLMLPDGNGYQIVRSMRKDTSTCDIPVVMLTVVDDEEYQIEGYKAGADDYMLKPCNFRLLMVRIMQLIKWSMEHTRRTTDNEKLQTGTVKEAKTNAEIQSKQAVILKEASDRAFIEKVNFYIDKYISDATFNIDALAELMGMGRTKFFGKMKELTGMPPNAYIMDKRLNKAAELLAEGNLNVAEVSYETGFNTPQYFSKCFKAKFGVSPKEYKG